MNCSTGGGPPPLSAIPENSFRAVFGHVVGECPFDTLFVAVIISIPGPGQLLAEASALLLHGLDGLETGLVIHGGVSLADLLTIGHRPAACHVTDQGRGYPLPSSPHNTPQRRIDMGIIAIPVKGIFDEAVG